MTLSLATCVTLRAGVLLSGTTAGFFRAVSGTYFTTKNSPDGLNSSFRTGVPVENSFKSGVKFNGGDFEDLQNGDTFSLGMFTYYNGISCVGTSSGKASFDFYLNFDDPKIGRVRLTTITFSLDATVNKAGTMTADKFTASFLQPSPIWLGDELVKFTINGLPSSLLVNENAWTDLANVTATATLVPESSTYAFVMGGLILAFAFFHRQWLPVGASRLTEN